MCQTIRYKLVHIVLASRSLKFGCSKSKVEGGDWKSRVSATGKSWWQVSPSRWRGECPRQWEQWREQGGWGSTNSPSLHGDEWREQSGEVCWVGSHGSLLHPRMVGFILCQRLSLRGCVCVCVLSKWVKLKRRWYYKDCSAFCRENGLGWGRGLVPSRWKDGRGNLLS